MFDNENKCNPQRNNCCFCGPTGPRGPTGPAGPVTVSVGTTTTIQSGQNASVINSGTANNVILDFSIPTGPTARLFKSSNKNNHRFKLNNSL